MNLEIIRECVGSRRVRLIMGTAERKGGLIKRKWIARSETALSGEGKGKDGEEWRETG